MASASRATFDRSASHRGEFVPHQRKTELGISALQLAHDVVERPLLHGDVA